MAKFKFQFSNQVNFESEDFSNVDKLLTFLEDENERLKAQGQSASFSLKNLIKKTKSLRILNALTFRLMFGTSIFFLLFMNIILSILKITLILHPLSFLKSLKLMVEILIFQMLLEFLSQMMIVIGESNFLRLQKKSY